MSRVLDGNVLNYLSSLDDIGITGFPCTIFSYVKITTLPISSGTIFMYSNADISDASLQNQILSTDVFRGFRKENALTATVTGLQTPVLNNWIPVICIYNADGSLRIVTPTSDVTTVATTIWTANVVPKFYIGLRGAYSDLPMIGKVAHFTVWSTVLGASDVIDILAGTDPIGIAVASQTRNWPFTTSSLTDTVAAKVLTLNGTVALDVDNPTLIGVPSSGDIAHNYIGLRVGV